MAFNKIRESSVLVNEIANNIKNEIINGNIKPGQRIIETYIAKEMGVSRSPLREAIHKLKAENVLKVIPYKGTYVNALSREDVEAIYDLRAILEMYAVEKLIEKNRNDENIEFLNILDKKVKEMELEVKENNINEFIKEDIEFHHIIVSFCGNKFLLKTWEEYVLQIRILLNIEARQREQFLISPKEHKQIVALIREKNVKQSKEYIKKHIFKSLKIYFNSTSKDD